MLKVPNNDSEQYHEDDTSASSLSVQVTESISSAFSQSSQMQWEYSQELEVERHDKERQTDPFLVLKEGEYHDFLREASYCCNFKAEVEKIRSSLSAKPNTPEMDLEIFEKLCIDAGAGKLVATIYQSICTERMSESRVCLNKSRTMVIIYMLIYGQSQKANSFQVALSTTLRQFGLSEQGLMSLRNLGIAAHPHTIKAAAKSSASSYPNSLVKFFQDAVNNEKLVVVMIDDYHNIHTKHRPESKTQTNAVHMSTLLVKVFDDVDAISANSSQRSSSDSGSVIGQRMPLLCSRYAENMPDWVVAKYFDPASERQRLVIHGYQQTEIQTQRYWKSFRNLSKLSFSHF